MRAGVDAGAAAPARRVDRRGDDDRDERRGRARRPQLRRDGAKFLAGGFAAPAARAPRAMRGDAGASAGRASSSASFAPDFGRLALEHLLLVFGSLVLAVASACRSASPPGAGRRSEATLLGAVAVLQTIPSLALLAFLIALVGSIGVVPAVIALFLYALLPIVRNTHAGLAGRLGRHGAGGAVARPDAAPGAAPRPAAARRADDARRHQDRGGDQRRHGDDGRVHRRRRLRRAHRRRARRQRQHGHARRRVAGRGAGAARPGRRSISPSGGRGAAGRADAPARALGRRVAAATIADAFRLADVPACSPLLVAITLWIALAPAAASTSRERRATSAARAARRGLAQRPGHAPGARRRRSAHFQRRCSRSRATWRARRTSRSTASAASSRRRSSSSPSRSRQATLAQVEQARLSRETLDATLDAQGRARRRR